MLTGPGPAATAIGNPKPTAAIAKPLIKKKDHKDAAPAPAPSSANTTASTETTTKTETTSSSNRTIEVAPAEAAPVEATPVSIPKLEDKPKESVTNKTISVEKPEKSCENTEAKKKTSNIKTENKDKLS